MEMQITSIDAITLDQRAAELETEAERLLVQGAHHGRVGSRRHAATALRAAAGALRCVENADIA